MCQLRSVVLTECYLAKDNWVETIFLLITTHDNRGITVVNSNSIHRSFLHKFVSKITIHTVVHAKVLCSILPCKTLNHYKLTLEL